MNPVLTELFSGKSKFATTQISIIQTLSQLSQASIGDIAEKCNLSVPTTTKFVDEMVRDNVLKDLGQHHKTGGRRPNMFAIRADIGYFVGVDLKMHTMTIGIMSFDGNLAYRKSGIEFTLEDPDAFDHACTIIEQEIAASGINQDAIIAYTISIPGRVNVITGQSFNYFTEEGENSREKFRQRLGAEVYIENDSRVMCYGEYIHSHFGKVKDMLYINLSWGLGMGMILDGKLYYGSNGMSGELGHVTMFDNEVICRCGKKGCLETEASGCAIERILKAKHIAGAKSSLSPKIDAGEHLTINDFINAVKSGDMLMIEIIEEIGTSLGKGIAAMVNIFNPQMVVLGGALAETEDFLLMSTISSVRKHSISVVNRGTSFCMADTGVESGVLGCCYIARDKTLKIL